MTTTLLLGIAILCSASVVPDSDMPLKNSPTEPLGYIDTLSIQESIVRSNFSSDAGSPLRLKTVGKETLSSRGASRTYPELLNGIPSLYATSESGSYGDAKLNIRGFGQSNIAVTLNGIPISGLVSGNMYWNNWMGLADATYAIQVQKGVGSSFLTDGSVGGTVNIVTEVPDEKFDAEAGIYGSFYGTVKAFLKIGSGNLPKGWSVNLMASYVGGDGYVDATKVNSFAYMLNVCKTIGNDHKLILTALGSPEQHEQRGTRLSWEEVQKYGLRYNRNWGLRDGQAFNLNLNNYFKPYFTLQHIWSGERISMKNSVYVTVGNGGGRWSENKNTPILYRSKDGLIDWDGVIATNRETEDGQALSILSDYKAGHTHFGAISSMEYRLDGGWTIGAGIHYQYYSTWENEKISDLLGGEWWYEDYEHTSLAGLAGRNPVKTVGDYIRTDNGKVTNHGTAYLSAGWKSEKVNVNFGASVFGAATRRWDKYNYYGGDIWSPLAGGVGGSIKAGALYKIGLGHSLYVNGGWYSRLPYSNVWFASGNNEISRDVKNEMNAMGEAGWRCVWNSGALELTGYASLWKDKSLMSNAYKVENSLDVKYMVTGLDAFHCGVEFEIRQRITDWIRFSAFASVGNWKWMNDVSATIYDHYSGNAIGEINVYCAGLPVGDAPQTQIGADLDIDIPAGFGLNLNWRFNDRMYADFDPVTRTNPDDRTPSYRFPSYHLLGAQLSWTRRKSHPEDVGCRIFLGGNNLLDSVYIERGKDGASHNLETFRGYWGFGRNFSFGLCLSF